jgi:adenylate cyclase
VLVCEIFNHDELMASLPVADYVAMTNLFLQTASDFLVEKGGYLDECDGESLRIIFGAPLPDLQHATTASEAALELFRRLDNLNRECDAKWHKMFDHRIGINSGDIVTAAYGSQRLATYSVAGEPVEFARRLCAANTVYGSRILLGSRTYNFAANDIEVRPMEIVRGRDHGLCEEIYELLERKGALSPEEMERRDRFWKGIIYFRENRWDEALSEFQAVLDTNEADLPAQFYVRRIEHMRTGAAPALQWGNFRF